MRAITHTAASVCFTALVLGGCSQPNVREISSPQTTIVPITSTTVWTVPVPVMTVPLADFKGMHGFKLGEEFFDALMCGWLYIHEPYVHVLSASPDWDASVDFFDLDLESLHDDDSVEVYWVHLPRYGTRYHPPSRSLWVWDGGPMTDGDFVCAGGGGERSNYSAISIHERGPRWHASSMNPAEPPPINPETTH